eukprot:881609-Amphidinium_carterae.1
MRQWLLVVGQSWCSWRWRKSIDVDHAPHHRRSKASEDPEIIARLFLLQHARSLRQSAQALWRQSCSRVLSRHQLERCLRVLTTQHGRSHSRTCLQCKASACEVGSSRLALIHRTLPPHVLQEGVGTPGTTSYRVAEGTYAYMSPERLRNSDSDTPAADVYAFAM